MATSGVTTGSSTLDVESIVSQLMKIERRPVTNIDTKITNKGIEISAFGTLKAKASALESALSAIENPASYTAKGVSSSDSAAVTAEVTSGASAADIDLKVVSTARASRLAVNGFSSETAAVGDGNLTLETGAYSTSNGTTTFASSKSKTITVPVGATLTDLRDLINKSGANVSASIVKTGTTYSLAINGTQTGTDNAIRISTSGAQNLPGNSAPDFTSIAFSASTGEISTATVLQSAKNSVVYVDGLRVERSSNTIDNAVTGVTFKLHKPTSLSDDTQATSTTVSISEQSGQARSVLDKVVSTYNDLVQTYKSLTVSNVDATKRGVLNSDTTASSLMSRMRELMSSQGISYNTTDANGATVTSTLLFSQVGVELQRDGTLKMNETTFSSALNDGTLDKLKTGVSVSAQAFLKTAVGTGGLFDDRTSSAQETQKTLQKRKAEIEDMLTRKETNLRRTYSSLDATLFKLNNLNSSLQQTLDAITAQQNT